MPADANHAQIERWFGIYQSAVKDAAPVPLLHDAARWLHAHAPVPDRLATVHGDAGPANFVHADGKVVAITESELVISAPNLVRTTIKATQTP